MGKIVCVWGNSGSGKTTFATLLARDCAAKKLQTILISPDPELPMLPVLFPTLAIEPTNSLGDLTSTEKTTPSLIGQHVVISKESDQLGVLAYAAGDHALSYATPSFDYVKKLVMTVSSLCDIVVVDCPSSLATPFTAAAMETADVRVRVITGDLRGAVFMQSQRQMLSDKRYHFDEHLTFVGQMQPYTALDNLQHIIGRIDGTLAYNPQIVRMSHEGGVFDLSLLKGDYAQAVKCVEEAVNSVTTA